MAKVESEITMAPFNMIEIEQILAACEHGTVRNIIQTGFWTGMRIGEMFALECSDINFKDEIIHISKTITLFHGIKNLKLLQGSAI